VGGSGATRHKPTMPPLMKEGPAGCGLWLQSPGGVYCANLREQWT
jgi:hypothetical protein